VQRIGRERDLAQRAGPRIVPALKITLKGQAALAHYDDAVKIPNALLRDCLVQQCFKISCEARFAWSDGNRIGPGSRGRSDRLSGGQPLMETTPHDYRRLVAITAPQRDRQILS
jgi:hypothetical protein